MDKWPKNKIIVDGYKRVAKTIQENPAGYLEAVTKLLANRFLCAIEEIERLQEVESELCDACKCLRFATEHGWRDNCQDCPYNKGDNNGK